MKFSGLMCLVMMNILEKIRCKQTSTKSYRVGVYVAYISALQPVCTVHPRVHKNKGAPLRNVSQRCITNLSHLTDNFYKNFLLEKMNH